MTAQPTGSTRAATTADPEDTASIDSTTAPIGTATGIATDTAAICRRANGGW